MEPNIINLEIFIMNVLPYKILYIRKKQTTKLPNLMATTVDIVYYCFGNLTCVINDSQRNKSLRACCRENFIRNLKFMTILEVLVYLVYDWSPSTAVIVIILRSGKLPSCSGTLWKCSSCG